MYELPANLERVLLGHKLTRKGERGSSTKQNEETWTDASCKIRHEVKEK